jgi:hypothetical protein
VRMRFKPGSLYTGEYTVNNIAYDAQGIRYYALNGLTGFHWERCLEPIPTETWRDVTAECEVHNNGMQIDHFVHGEPGHYGIIRVMGNDNQRDGSFLPYRIAKVPVCREGGFVDCGKCDMWAFIVEKREP